jgi:hypothetical protein
MADIVLEPLIIDCVDLIELEGQRKHLNSIIHDDSILSCMTAEQQDALQGIEAMLDQWSDNRYFKER